MKYFFVIYFTVCINIVFVLAAPQGQIHQQPNPASPPSQAMTAASVTNGLAITTGFMNLFGSLINNVWTSIPKFIALFQPLNPAGQPNLPLPVNLPNMPNTQFIQPIRQVTLPQTNMSIDYI